ncbi:MAG: ATP-binding protein [Patescibacteria group bacterium]
MNKQVLTVQAGIDRNAIMREVSRIPPRNALAELIDNCFDAGSLHCNIYVEGKSSPTKILLVDSGSGLNEDALKAFFVYGKSEWQSKRHKGRNGKGSKYMLWHASKILVRTRCRDEANVKTFQLDLENWMKQILKGESVAIETDSKVGAHEFDPPKGAFTLIEISPKKEVAKEFTEETLLESMAELLSPQYADRVFVNGKNLAAREVSSFQDQTNVPTLGDVRVYIYQPTDVKYRDGIRLDELQIGSIGPVTDFRTFIRNLPLALRSKVPFTFSDRNICGLIEVDAFNEWREGASREFRDGLYHSSEIAVFISYLAEVLGPKISKEFGLESAEMQDREKRNFDALRKLTEDAFGGIKFVGPERKPPKSRAAFHISPWTITMVPGEEQVFEAKGKTDQTYEWDASDIPGASLDQTTNEKVTLIVSRGVKYNPDEQYRLIAKEKSSGFARTAYVKIVPAKGLTLVPASGTYTVNNMVTFKAINLPAETTTLDWQAKPSDSGEFLKVRGVNNVSFILKKPGRCLITAIDPKNSRVSAVSDIYIKEESIDIDRPGPDVPLLKLEDTIVEIKTLTSPDVNLQGFVEERTADHIVFHLNVNHPKYHKTMKTSESGWREYVLGLIVNHYISWLSVKENLNSDDQLRRIGSIMAKLA